MTFDDLTIEEIKDILYACKDLVDGNFNSAKEIEEFTGLYLTTSKAILTQINILKELDIG